jgi:PAS domain S-box-containing protein
MRRNVLIVEDEYLVALDLAGILAGLHYIVAGTVSSGKEAIEAALSQKPDIILMDIRLKGNMDGIEAARLIREQMDIPIIYATAYSDPETLERAKITDPFGYVLKPYNEREVHTALEIALYKHGAEKELRENRRFLATTLQSIGDGVIAADARGTIRIMNPVAQALTGRESSPNDTMLLADVFVLEGEDQKTVSAEMEQFLVSQGDCTGAGHESALVHASGRLVPVEWRICPMRDERGKACGVVLTFRDISQRKTAQDLLRASEKKYRQLVELAQEGIWATDNNGVTTYSNPRMGKMLGYAEGELAQHHFLDFVDTSGDPSSLLNLNSGKGWSNGIYELNLVKKDGSRIPTRFCTSPICDEHGNFTGSLAVVTDISEQKLMEELERDILTKVEEHILQFAILGDHIRNPLATIVGLADLQGGDLSNRIHHQAQIIDSCIDRLDQGWIESEYIRNFIREHYGIAAAEKKG